MTLKNINKETFDSFISQQTNKHYMQSLCWGEYSKTVNHLTPYYLGLIDENNKIIAATLLLQNYILFNYCCFYIPYGFIIDYTNKELVKEMTKQIKHFIKKKKGIFFTINPNIIVNQEIINNLKEIGYKHQNSTKQQIILKKDLKETIESIEKDLPEIIKEEIQQATTLSIDLNIGSKNDIKKEFPSSNYETLYEIFNGNKNTTAVLFLVKLNFTKTIKNLENIIKKINNQISILPIDNLSKHSKEKLEELTKQKNTINEKIKLFKEHKNNYEATITLSSQLMLTYSDTAWIIDQKDYNTIPGISLNYYIYYEHIKYCKEHKINMYNTINKIKTIDEAKYIGEFNYIINKPLYLLYKIKTKD